MTGPYRIMLNGGDSDTVELELDDLPEHLEHEGTTYTLRRDEHQQPSRDVFGRYRYFWIWPRSEVAREKLAGHTTTDRMVPRPPTVR